MYIKTDLRAGDLTVYGTGWCGYTKKQRQYLNEKGIAYNYIDCEAQSCPGFVDGYPTLVLDGRVIHGFTEV